LSRFSLFAGLDDRARREVAQHIHERIFAAGQVIVLADELCQAVYLVVQGEVRAYHISREGREYALHDIVPGCAFNLSPAFDGGLNLATVIASTGATLYVVPCEAFCRIVRDHHAVSMAVIEHLAGRMRYLSDAVEDLALRTVRARLARCLLSIANGDGSPAQRWTQEELAVRIGSVRDVVGRTLRAFSRAGLIRRWRGRIVIADLAALRREAMCE
jgi:CRP/FNR family transcriptional regulator